MNAAELKEYHKQWRRARRSAVAMLKLERGCARCGYDEDPAALDFDHPGEDKVDNVARMVNDKVAMERILAEIDKCQVLCANCHRITTEERRRLDYS